MKEFEFNHEKFKEAFKHMHGHPFMNERVRRFGQDQMSYEVKLFTNKDQMVAYVNNLTGIENVEIFKIEDDLYKVLVSRRKVTQT